MAILNPQQIDVARKEVDRVNSESRTADALMEGITVLLNQHMLKYNWVGFYMFEENADPPMLVLGHYQGAMTPHTRIPLNQGICGAAASSGKTVVVDDVKKDSRYLACSLETKSEIVVPIFVRGKVAGELDIDSHFLAAFSSEDRELIEYCAQLVGKRLETEPA
ncbi:MAG: GAF domain-containing protein [Terriglobales bacterium]